MYVKKFCEYAYRDTFTCFKFVLLLLFFITQNWEWDIFVELQHNKPSATYVTSSNRLNYVTIYYLPTGVCCPRFIWPVSVYKKVDHVTIKQYIYMYLLMM